MSFHIQTPTVDVVSQPGRSHGDRAAESLPDGRDSRAPAHSPDRDSRHPCGVCDDWAIQSMSIAVQIIPGRATNSISNRQTRLSDADEGRQIGDDQARLTASSRAVDACGEWQHSLLSCSLTVTHCFSTENG